MKHAMYLVRCVLWVALVGTTAFSFLLWVLLEPQQGDVAQIIELVVCVALGLVWIALWPQRKTEEDLDILLKRLAASRK